MSQAEDEDIDITEAEINEFCGNEDKIMYIEEAIRSLQYDLTQEVVKEGSWYCR